MDVLLEKTKDAGVPGAPGSFAALMAVGGDLDHLFRRAVPQLLRLLALRARQGDACARATSGACRSTSSCSRWSPASRRSRPSRSIGEVLLHPEQISAKFDSWFLALLAALTFAVATLGINVVANFVSPAFDFSNVFPQQDRLQEGRLYRGADRAGALSVRALGGQRGRLRRRHRRDDGPDLRRHHGRLLPDRKGEIDVAALYGEDGEFRFQNGWNVNAFIAAAIGALFSTILPNFTNLLPAGGASTAGSSASASPARSTTCCDRPRWAAASVSPAPDQRSASRKILPPGRIFHVRFRPRKDP